jgi:hypothetical protein
MKTASATLARTLRLQMMSATSPISFVSPPLGRIEEKVQLHPDEVVGNPFQALCPANLGHPVIAAARA